VKKVKRHVAIMRSLGTAAWEDPGNTCPSSLSFFFIPPGKKMVQAELQQVIEYVHDAGTCGVGGGLKRREGGARLGLFSRADW